MSDKMIPISTVPVHLKKPKFAKCRVHGNGGMGYVSCIHVLQQGAPVGFMEHPGMSHPTLGSLLCDGCYESNPVNYDLLRIACAKCVTDRGFNKPKGIAAKPLIVPDEP